LLDFTRRFVSQFQGSATLLAVAEDSEQCESLATFLRSTLGEREAADFEVSARAGKVQDVILDEISRGAYEVLFFEADERSETGLGRRDSSFQSILEQSAIPALIVPRAVTAPQSNSLPSARDDETDKPAGEPERVGAIRRVLICTAAGEPGKSDVRMGGWVARRLGAEATLLHVARIGGGADPEIHRYMNLAACTLSNQDTKNRTLVREAPRPATGILKEIREGSYDLVVMGRHAPRAKARLPGENVTLRVLNAAQRPVLVVPNEEVG
jgi:nucleotide-binding universal stress UspA family protein